jgi:DNA polymerase I-like protein with 3'-5' exonuclease and polymerase domains|tara:strand:+ start:810 stop:2642 length:1833 start_codon:yes stop_codon:yes gene_type:complete
MDLITIDFETYYDQEYSLSKLTTEEYVRDTRFEVIGVAIKVNNEAVEWASGTNKQMAAYLNEFDWSNSMVLAHNTMFDGAILSWRYGIKPKAWADTLCMARAVHGTNAGGSLKALTERYKLGAKGTEVIAAKGMNRDDFSSAQLSKYGDYCINDVELTYKLFRIMGKGFPKQELKIIDLTLRMFVEPELDLDLGLLEVHLDDTKENKDRLLEEAGVSKDDLMSNLKFAELLTELGVEPPTKVSLTTGKETLALAKTDEGFKALETHEDVRVQSLVTARLGNKSTLEETRTQRFIDIAKRGLLPVPIQYYAAHTGRWGGADKINIQNLPSRGPNGKKLKNSIIAPEGYMIIDADSAQIEARVLAWLAEQDDLVEAFAKGEDVYKKMASDIYDIDEDKVTKDQRFVGKTTILGAGYGMGAVRFKAQLQLSGFDMQLKEARRVIKIYRDTNWKINHLWREAQNLLTELTKKNCRQTSLGKEGVLDIVAAEKGIRLPSGLLLRYEDLSFETNEEDVQFTYKVRNGRNKIYGGKVVENVCQAIARCIIAEQMLKITKKYRVVMTVHDSVVCCVPETEVSDAQAYIEKCMRWTPDWAEGLPIDCESGVGRSYGECE